jgi:hypothetical protein
MRLPGALSPAAGKTSLKIAVSLFDFARSKSAAATFVLIGQDF